MKKTRLEMIMKKFLIISLIIQPIFDLNILYNSYSTLIRIMPIAIVFNYYFFINKNNKKYYLLVYPIILGSYFILHHVNAQNFKSYVPGNFNYSIFKEALYFIKMLSPLLLIYSIIEADLKKRDIMYIIKWITIIISGIIIFSNITGTSLCSYSTGIIKANIFTWFNNSQGYTYKELLSKGYFEYANQISAILIIFFSFNILQTINEKDKVTNYIVATINLIALMMIGTRVAVIGTVIVYIYTMFIMILYKKRQIRLKDIIMHAISFAMCIILIYYNPIFSRFEEIDNLKEQEDNLSISQTVETKSLKITEDNSEKNIIEIKSKESNKEEYIFENYKDKRIYEYFILNSYPYKYDTDFWYEIMQKDITIRTNYRYIEKAMIKRVVEVNNNSMDKLFGITYTRVQNIFNIEQDFIMQYYSLGILGLSIILLPYCLMIINYIIKFLKAKGKGICIESVLAIITIIFAYGIAYNSGNLLNSLGFTIYFSIVFSQINIQNKEGEKICFLKV